MRRYCYILLAGIILATCVACGGQISITTLADTSANQIDLSVEIYMGFDASAQPKNTLILDGFYHGVAVGLTHHETMTCNGEAIAPDPDNAGFIATDFAITDAAAPITCVYQSESHVATFSLSLLPAPQVLAPKDNVTINHLQPVAITYIAGQGKTIRALAAVFDAPPAARSASKTASDTGSITLATQNLQTGAGFIQVERTTDGMITGSPFHSLHIDSSTTTYIPVTWT